MKTSKLLALAALAASVVAVPLVMAQAADKGKAAETPQNAQVDRAQTEAEQKAKRRAAAAAQDKAKADQPAPREEECHHFNMVFIASSILRYFHAFFILHCVFTLFYKNNPNASCFCTTKYNCM